MPIPTPAENNIQTHDINLNSVLAFSPPIRIRPKGEMIKNKIKQVRAIIDKENKVSNKSRIRSRDSTKIDVDVSGKAKARLENISTNAALIANTGL